MSADDVNATINGLGKRLLGLFTLPSSSAKEISEANSRISELLRNMEILDQAQRSKLLLLLGSGAAKGRKRGTAEQFNLRKLTELLDNPKTLSDWLDLYSPQLLKSFLKVYKNPQSIQATLDTFTPSAITFLMENVGFVGLSNVVNVSSESSTLNKIFAGDKLRFSRLKGNGAANREYELFKEALMGLGSFQTEAAFHVKHRMLHMHASLEGDVA